MKMTALNTDDRALLSAYDVPPACTDGARRFTFESGEHITTMGVDIQYLYIVVSGKARICINTASGKQLLLCYFVSRGILGDLELMTGEYAATTTIEAITPCVLVGISLRDCGAALKGDIRFMQRIGEELARKLMRSSTNSAITVLNPLKSRLCAYIMQTAVGGIFSESLSDVSYLLGASYRHLIRCMKTLCEEGILEKHRASYHIMRAEQLASSAGDLYMTEDSQC